MPKRMRKTTCEAFQKFAIDLINSGADPEDTELEPHVKQCAGCRQFLQEITIISDAAHSLFPAEWKSLNRPNYYGWAVTRPERSLLPKFKEAVYSICGSRR